MDIFPRPKTKIPGDSENNFSEPYNIFLSFQIYFIAKKNLLGISVQHLFLSAESFG